MTQEEDDNQHEYESVSRQSDEILTHMQDRFEELMSNQRTDDAICIGDEFLEWIRQDPDELFLYYNEKELQNEYKFKRRK